MDTRTAHVNGKFLPSPQAVSMDPRKVVLLTAALAILSWLVIKLRDGPNVRMLAGPGTAPRNLSRGGAPFCPITASTCPIAGTLVSKVLRVQEEERRKVSIDLRDDIAQVLGNLVLITDACLAIAPPNPPDLRRYLADARETAKGAFRRVERFAVELRPSMLDDMGLGPTIAWLCERLSRETNVPIAAVIPEELPPLTRDQATALFRIAQEALENVLRHAHARHAKVTLDSLDEQLIISVSDDGVGFDQDLVERDLAQGKHFGLTAVRYRAEAIKAKCTIKSVIGEGTLVQVAIPVAVVRATESSGAFESARQMSQ